MQTIEYRTVDKRAWGLGPWLDEPDKKQWSDPATGLPCLIVRNHFGALCGYVGVGAAHQDFKRDHDEADLEIEVHGGLTFSGMCQHGDDEAKGICHIPGDGEPDEVWWFGFDCAHIWDFVPGRRQLFWEPEWEPEATYRTIAYVEKQVKSLARQFADRKQDDRRRGP